ncbi:pilus assembly protein [Colwellia echini]|uniref:VWFA domain-containing protein n=1 Tax=Colwellia echini TaxID=1982103 RepID=A0ABY3MVG9_9GAMM|nr:PilC/PilY family type IV pilus protein [Colwellia echini]TYK65190.1 hypothetical protein CWS31_012030 [Colwellia echini]
MKKYLLVMLLMAWSNQSLSDDIDLYIKNDSDTTPRPTVLIILDNSGSMSDNYADNTSVPSSLRSVNTPNTRSHVAREIIIDLINDNPEVDFALQIFNNNNQNNRNGGRIISGFKDLSVAANKTALIDLLDNDTDNTNNNYTLLRESHTPLCENLYETYRYLSGGDVYYGIQNTNTPLSIVTTGKYTSPFKNIKCDKTVTIIYITDGEATNDTDANNRVKNLTGAKNSDKVANSFLAALGSWMGTRNWTKLNGVDNDDKTDANTSISNSLKSGVLGSVSIHTVGFGNINENTSVVELLKKTARHGEVEQEKSGYHTVPAGGKYHQASDAEALKTALQAVVKIVLDSRTLTSASVSANSFDRTQTLDSVYYGVFEPTTAARWQGNIKKYKIRNGVQVDALSKAAIDNNGEFKQDAKSFWSDTVDGNEVDKGGVAEMLRATDTANRKFFHDIDGADKPLVAFDKPSDIISKYAGDEERLKTTFDVTNTTDVTNHIKWAMGINVDNVKVDNIIPTIRPDVFGDPLHSKPIVVNYGTGNSRIVIGTNAGVLHMFEDKSDTEVVESWAYLPQEFYSNIKKLRNDEITVGNKVYGIDGEITLHINDKNKNGIVDETDTAWLFFGLRRGGSSYYALDITSPDAPKLMWHIKNTDDFSELGLTFSTPQVVKSALNTTETDKLVVVFGGGYDDTKKDANTINAHDDTAGASIYMVSATTGKRLLKVDTDKKNGIAASVATLDSDSDGLVDRLYVGDTGGRVWRVDIPDATVANVSLTELANFSGTSHSDDIRFFNQPTIVRTYLLETYDVGTTSEPNVIKQEIPYDAILLGSGDKSDPLSSETNDKFFMLKDRYIKTQTFTTAPAEYPITLSKLYDYSDNPFEGYPILTAKQQADLLVASQQSGWYFDLALDGEKNTAQAIVLNNVVYFTSYVPESETTCSVQPGNAWLYALDLAQGIQKFDWGDDADNRGDRIKHIGSQFLGAPTLISTTVETIVDDETISETEGNLIVGKEVLPVGFSLQTMRTSLTIPEN